MFKRNSRSTVKGMAAGAVGGLAASWLMGYAHIAFDKLSERVSTPDAGGSPPAAPRRPRPPASDEEQANVKAAVAVAHAAGRELSPEQQQRAGAFVHYAFGTVVGTLYGAAAEHSALARAGSGAPFGAVLWLLSDEVAVPSLKLSRPPRDYAREVHASALAAHLVYGVTTELLRRGLRQAFAR